MTQKKYKNRGFTLIEMIIVLAILAILATLAIPSLMSFMDSGKQTSRNNIARTLYISAQSELTQKRLTDTLGDFAAKANVLPEGVTIKETERREDIGYIENTLADGKLQSLVEELLGKVVLDKSILKHAITIEFNRKTGVVLSVFYSEEVTRLAYGGAENGRENINGSRPYEYSAHRKQGYYGVGTTSQVAPINVATVVKLYDGAEKMIREGNDENVNILYAEIYLPKNVDTATLEIVEKEGGIKYSERLSLPTTESNLRSAYTSPLGAKKHLLYKTSIAAGEIEEFGVDMKEEYSKYIWVIDYVYGNLVEDQLLHSIGKKYGILPSGAPLNDIAVQVKKDEHDSGKVSNYLNPYYWGENGLLGGTYTLASPRHLSNIRYVPKGNFVQVADIDMKDIGNFMPIERLDGSYNGYKNAKEQYVISGLKIEERAGTQEQEYVGLFRIIAGTVRGISLDNAQISSIDSRGEIVHIGAIGGVLSAGKVIGCNSFANVTAAGGKNVNAGGLIGTVILGTVEQSYNGGTEHLTAPLGAVTVKGTGYTEVVIGGLVGESTGTIQNCYNNARVNIVKVRVGTEGAEKGLSMLYEDTPNSSYPVLVADLTDMGGIVGRNSGMVKNVYATNHIGAPMNAKGEYLPANIGGIVGSNSEPNNPPYTNSYFITNRHMDEGVIDKNALSQKDLSSAFVQGTGYPQSPVTQYPYPTLRNNAHRTAWGNKADLTEWEDIQESVDYADPEDILKYYEVYEDGTSGLYSVDESGSEISTLKDNIAVVEDGYCLYGNNTGEGTFRYKVTGLDGNKPIQVTYANGKWTADAAAKGRVFNKALSNVKLYTPDQGLTTKASINVLAIHNSKIIETMGDKTKPATLQFDAKSGGDDLTFIFNPLWGKAMTKKGIPKFAIRSPRHFVNINYVADKVMTFNQQAPLDFSKYSDHKNNNEDIPELVPQYRSFTNAIITSAFKGTYKGNGYRIQNVEITGDSDNVGLFKTNEGTISGISLANSKMSGGDTVGGIAAVNKKSLSVSSVMDTQLIGKNKVGGIVGNNESGTVTDVFYTYTNADTLPRNPQKEKFSSGIVRKGTGGQNFGGLVGYLTTGRVSSSYSANFSLESANLSDGHLKPIVGNASLSNLSTASVEHVYYLAGIDFNHGKYTLADQGLAVTANQLKHLVAESKAPGAVIPFPTSLWQEQKETTGYPYPMLRGMKTPEAWCEPEEPLSITYYEKYQDGSYGLYTVSGYGQVEDHLTKNLQHFALEDGYFIESDQDLTVKVGNFESKIASTALEVNGATMSVVHLPLDSIETQMGYLGQTTPTPISAKRAGGQDVFLRTFINPLFGKQIFANATPPGIQGAMGKAIEIRTTRQFSNMIKAKGNTAIFSQTLDIDFKNQERSTPVMEEFPKGSVYSGNGHQILGVNIRSEESYMGLFGKNNGTIQNVTLLYSTIKGDNYVGGIAGLGGKDSRIENCVVAHSAISGNYNVGGAMGMLESGVLNGILVDNTTLTAASTTVNSMGGIVGNVINSGRVSNVLYNYATEQAQNSQYVAGIKKGSEMSSAVGGIVGAIYNSSVTNALSIAYFEGKHNGEAFPTIGSGIPKNGTGTVFYLTGGLNEENYPEGQGTGLTTTELKNKVGQLPFTGGNGWNTTTEGYPYPRPVVASKSRAYIPKHWIEPTVQLLYYEQYTDDSFGYWGMNGVNSLATEGKIVRSDGYIVTGVGDKSYSFKTGEVTQTERAVTMDKRWVVKIPYQLLESAMGETPEKPVQILIREGTTAPTSANDPLLLGSADTYISPYYAQQIYASADEKRMFEIRTPRQFLALGKMPVRASDPYVFNQTLDIDFEKYQLPNYLPKTSFENNVFLQPDGTQRDFVDTYNGNGHSINAMKIQAKNDQLSQNVGIFSDIKGTIRNWTLKDMTVSGGTSVGILAGTNNGNIENVTITGTSTVSSSYNKANQDGKIGGLVGTNYGTINGGGINGTVVVEGSGVKLRNANVGGVVGENHSIMGATAPIYVAGKVIVLASGSNVGGFAGLNGDTGEIFAAHVDGYGVDGISVIGTSNVGGLVGENRNTIGNESKQSTVSGKFAIMAESGIAGGVTGYNHENASIEQVVVSNNDSSDVRNFVIQGVNHVGGVAGRNAGSISNTMVQGVKLYGSTTYTQLVPPWMGFGGIAGENTEKGNIERSAVVNAKLTIKNASVVGGIVGYNDATISRCYVTDTLLHGKDILGGIAGANYGGIEDVFFTYLNTVISIAGEEGSTAVGGLIGRTGSAVQGQAETHFLRNAYYAALLPATKQVIGVFTPYNIPDGNETENLYILKEGSYNFDTDMQSNIHAVFKNMAAMKGLKPSDFGDMDGIVWKNNLATDRLPSLLSEQMTKAIQQLRKAIEQAKELRKKGISESAKTAYSMEIEKAEKACEDAIGESEMAKALFDLSVATEVFKGTLA